MPDAYFRLFITTDGGARIFIGRGKGEHSGKITLRAELKATPEERLLADSLSADEQLTALHELRLELSRAKIGYKGLDYINGFSLIKQLPLTSDLNEAKLVDAVWEVEAVLYAAIVILTLAAHRHRVREVDKSLATT